MSTWHILTGTSFDAPDDGLVAEWPRLSEPNVGALDTSDAESDPGEDDLVHQVIAMLPQGAAWGSPDGEAHDMASEMTTFWRGWQRFSNRFIRTASRPRSNQPSQRSATHLKIGNKNSACRTLFWFGTIV